ncbi:hypothetical protein BDB01DRAFT_284486 [Pilobolus umbonatus]|nr:hypothetical protein BDB01DRAFT_284486 [Pilobolus umbonatus]
MLLEIGFLLYTTQALWQPTASYFLDEVFMPLIHMDLSSLQNPIASSSWQISTFTEFLIQMLAD